MRPAVTTVFQIQQASLSTVNLMGDTPTLYNCEPTYNIHQRDVLCLTDIRLLRQGPGLSRPLTWARAQFEIIRLLLLSTKCSASRSCNVHIDEVRSSPTTPRDILEEKEDALGVAFVYNEIPI